MADSVTFKMEGFKEFADLVADIQNDYGPKDSKKILTGAVRQAMKPVLTSAKSLVAKDTGALGITLQIQAKKPSAKDKKSRYVSQGDAVIGIVSAYVKGAKLAKMKFKHAQTGEAMAGMKSDARANVQEFGSYKMPAHPYLRPSLESQGGAVVNDLGQTLGASLEKYKSKRT